MSTMAADSSRAGQDRQAQFQVRYGAVFLLVLTLLVFEVLVSDADWARAVEVMLAGTALTVAVATSRAGERIRHVSARAVGGVALVLVVAIAAGLVSVGVTFVGFTLLEAAIPFAVGGGLMRLVRERGVTLQVVAGALSVYLLAGLLFASVIGFVCA